MENHENTVAMLGCCDWLGQLFKQVGHCREMQECSLLLRLRKSSFGVYLLAVKAAQRSSAPLYPGRGGRLCHGLYTGRRLVVSMLAHLECRVLDKMLLWGVTPASEARGGSLGVPLVCIKGFGRRWKACRMAHSNSSGAKRGECKVARDGTGLPHQSAMSS